MSLGQDLRPESHVPADRLEAHVASFHTQNRVLRCNPGVTQDDVGRCLRADAVFRLFELQTNSLMKPSDDVELRLGRHRRGVGWQSQLAEVNRPAELAQLA